MLGFLRKMQRRSFKSAGRADVSMSEVGSCVLNHYFLHAHQDSQELASGGYEIDIFGNTGGSYDFAGKAVRRKGYRMHVRILAADVHGLPEPGTLGWGKLHDDYLEAVVLIHADQIRDLLSEIRFSKPSGVRVAGDCDDSGVMKLDMFAFYPEASELIT